MEEKYPIKTITKLLSLSNLDVYNQWVRLQVYPEGARILGDILGTDIKLIFVDEARNKQGKLLLQWWKTNPKEKCSKMLL